MSPDFFRCLPPAIILPLFAIALGGCASDEELAAQRKYESRDQRAHREVFYDNWLRPSVSEDEKDFYYRSFWKKE
jgi:hypothetical protein